MSVLSSGSRKVLEDACVRGRRDAEAAARAAIGSLGVADKQVPGHLDEGQRALRRGLRAKSRELGDPEGSVELLVAEGAFEQWHRLLFARFLAENNLLIHPTYRAPVTLAECDELAAEMGEPDGWAVAGRFAAEILPGIFRLDDPCVQLRLAPEGRAALEGIVAGVPAEVFDADDALGWVYQFWQKEKKDEANNSERKIGGADLGPVTQLFTENYMVRFLLENSLGAWWAARRPDSPLVKSWEFLRFDADGHPAAGAFDGWPTAVAEVTVMDPCCGSGHFLVEAFDMLWRMRAEEEGLGPVAAQDAVLRDNLFGLELDPRCVQIAMFAVALTAWKAGGGWRELPVPHVACSGIPVKAPVDEWQALAGGDPQLENALVRLHILFRDADTLGSLIDPKRAVELSDPTGLQRSFDDVEWDDIEPLLTKALTREADDPATAVLGANAQGITRAAHYLSRRYTLVCTNVPYLGVQKMPPDIGAFMNVRYPESFQDLATVFLERCLGLSPHGSGALVTPLSWAFLRNFSKLRVKLLNSCEWNSIAPLGKGAFSSISGEVVQSILLVFSPGRLGDRVSAVDVTGSRTSLEKAEALQDSPVVFASRDDLRKAPDTILALGTADIDLLSSHATSWQGLVTGDVAQFIVKFWEVQHPSDSGWERFLTAPGTTSEHAGRECLLRWEGGRGRLMNDSGAHNFNPSDVLHRQGVLVGQGSLRVTLYEGEMFNDASSPVIPSSDLDVPALWCYMSSAEYEENIRKINHKVIVGSGYLVKVPFDVERWRNVAAERYPDGLPDPWSDDPTQWLFEGRPEVATEPLQVAVGRLLGFRWPEQADTDDLDVLGDDDGIVCLPSVLGERTAADRLQEMLARAFGGTWSPTRTAELLAASGSSKTDLDAWLRDEFFKAHCQVFKNRPFVWHIWDGIKGGTGFSALVNYHGLDRSTLERLTYTYLGDWIERQTAGVRDDIAGAEQRLAAARDLQNRLELILDGEPPYDIYVRWKDLAEQPLGWEPDLNDGVRLNVRPFVEARALREKPPQFNVKWTKDRGKNPDGSERHNDLHVTRAEKEAARRGGSS